jgi:flagellar L-ring protein precursor FlgH
MRVLAAAWFIAIAIVFSSAACADSIWERRERKSAYLFRDNLALEMGDSLTVVIVDQSSFKKSGEREMEKTTSSSGSLNVETTLVDFHIPSGDLAQESSRKFEGSNEFNASREFEDSITVTVIDRLPNGNLVIAGRSERRIEEEDVVTTVTGIVKPEDVSAGITVTSTRVAHLKLYYETCGDSDAYMKRGFFNQILDYLWPF